MEKKNYATEEQKTGNIQGNGVLPCVMVSCFVYNHLKLKIWT